MDENESIKKNKSQRANKLAYILFLIGLLIVTIIYFQMIQNSSLFDIFSLFLGFVLCLIFQLRIIAGYFGDQMDQLNLNQFSIIMHLIKSKIFGELNSEYVAQKNKKKYYQHTKKKTDPLFADENEQIFEGVMAKMRVNSEIDNFYRIRLIRGKWDTIVFKISILERFFNQSVRLYKQRVVLYKNHYANTFAKYSSDEIRGWKTLFKDNSDMKGISQNNNEQINQYIEKYQLQEINWYKLSYLMAQRLKMTEKKIQDLSQRVIKECSLYLQEIKNHSKNGLQKLQLLQDEYTDAKKKSKQNKDKIQEKKCKIQIAAEKMKENKIQNDDNMELIFATEYELKLLNFDLEKLQIKKSYDYDMLLKKSQNLYKACVQQEKSIDSEQIFAFNKKILNYIDAIHDAEKFLHQKLMKRTTQPKQNNQFVDFEDLLSIDWVLDKFKQVEKKKFNFKQCIINMRNFLKQIEINISKTSKLTEDYQKQMTNRFSNENQTIYSLHQRMHDSILILTMKNISLREHEMILELQTNLEKQISHFITHEEQVKDTTKEIGILTGRLKKIKQDAQKQKKGKKQNNYRSLDIFNQTISIITIELIQKFKTYSQIKIGLYVAQTIRNLLNSQFKIYKYIQVRKQQLETKTQNYDKEDLALKRLNQYTDEIFKRQIKEQQQQNPNYFDGAEDTNKSQNKQEEKEKQEKSLSLVNKLLSVFFEEWSNSQFFHEILKEQIQISLNRKKPSFISYINAKYLKLQQKTTNIIESITILEDKIFVCDLQAIINFNGKIGVHIQTQIKRGLTKIPINIRLLITKFHCPLRVCFTPFSFGKSYGSLLKIPKLSIEIDVKIGNWDITKLPFVSKILQIFILIKLRKKLLWPKRFTLSVPLAVKNPIALAIRQTLFLDKQKQKKFKMI